MARRGMKKYATMMDDEWGGNGDVNVQEGMHESNDVMKGDLGIQYHGNMVAEPATVRGDDGGDGGYKDVA